MALNPRENDPKDFDSITKAPDVPFRDLHPSPGAGQKFKGKDLPPWGGSDGDEGEYFRCKQCGFINNKKRNSPGSGWGNDSVADISIIGGGTAHAKDPTSAAGCPLCNSSEAE